MTVRVEWSYFWLKLFDSMDSQSKTESLISCEIWELIKTSNDTTQIEILEDAPIELTRFFQSELRPRAAKKLLPNMYVEPSTQPRRVLPDKIYLDIAKRLRR